MPRAPGPTPTTQQRRRMLLDAAIEVVREQGPRASMEAMAAAGGVTKPILYRHFGDRAGLVAAIGEAFLHDLGDAISGALQRHGGSGDDGAVLRAAIDAYLALIERDTELYRFLVQQDARLGSERTSAFVAQVIEQVTGLVEAGLVASRTVAAASRALGGRHRRHGPCRWRLVGRTAHDDGPRNGGRRVDGTAVGRPRRRPPGQRSP